MSTETDSTQTGAEGQEHKIAWTEFQVPSLAAAKQFYGAVFGWTFTDYYEGFAICHTPGGDMVGGLDEVQGEPSGRQARVYIQTDDLEATLERVRQAGGEVVRERDLISEEFGWWALVADPSGLHVGLTTDRPATSGS